VVKTGCSFVGYDGLLGVVGTAWKGSGSGWVRCVRVRGLVW